jgi:hypothetical protein
MSINRKRITSLVIIALAALLVTTGTLAYVNRQYLQDLYAASQFTPDNELQQVIERIELSDAGDIIFRASAPTLESTQQFSTQCAAVMHRESDQVVGCYTGSRIHLFHIVDERLDGMVEVTAAHELLHAAYKRLSGSEKAALSAELESEYERLILEDPDIEKRMQVYQDLPPSGFVNELHSVLGTEVRALSPQLEAHYAKYFGDRQKILNLFDNYHTYFMELERERSQLSDELTALGADIDQRSAAYEQALAEYNAAVSSLIARNERFEFSDNPAEFYALRDQLNARRAVLESQRLDLNAAVETYNQKRERLLELDAMADELIRSIDSDFAPPSASA